MVCTAVAFGVAGFWLGWLTRPHGEAPPSPPPTVQSATPRAVTGLQRGLLCASRFPSTPDEPVDCAVPKLRADWCEGQLDECERSRESVRQQWPDDGTIEAPQAWANAVERALDECGIPGLELVECAEYPCVAALRPEVDGGPDEEAFGKEQKRLMDAVRSCAALRDAFGVTDDKALDVFANDTICPDGSRRDFFALMALDPAGPAYALLVKDDDRTKREERDLFRWLFRRGDDVAAQYTAIACDAS
jgi:hypothetical protein